MVDGTGFDSTNVLRANFASMRLLKQQGKRRAKNGPIPPECGKINGRVARIIVRKPDNSNLLTISKFPKSAFGVPRPSSHWPQAIVYITVVTKQTKNAIGCIKLYRSSIRHWDKEVMALVQVVEQCFFS